MKKFQLPGLLLLIMLAPAILHARIVNPVSDHPLLRLLPDPKAVYDSMWVEYDQVKDNKKGMVMHVRFTLYEMKDKDCQLAVYFQNENQQPLKDRNSQYNTVNGNVAVFKDLKPGFDPAWYNDLQIFMPYDELDLDNGEFNLVMDAELIYTDGTRLSHLTNHNFVYTQSGSNNTNNRNSPVINNSSNNGAPVAPPAEASFYATYTKSSVDYDVTDNGKLGLRVHVTFSTVQMKDKNAYLAIFYFTKDGAKVMGIDKEYRSSAGQLALYKSIKPNYDNADFNDLQLFLPYSEMDVTTGKYNMKMSVDVIMDNGDLVSHLTDIMFDFSK